MEALVPVAVAGLSAEFNPEQDFPSSRSACFILHFHPHPPHDKPHTTQQWRYKDFSLERKREREKTTWSIKGFCAKGPTLLYKTPFYYELIGFGVILMAWGFTHTDIYICSTILPSFWIHRKKKKKIELFRLFPHSFSLNLKKKNRIGPGWGYVLYSTNCLHTNTHTRLLSSTAPETHSGIRTSHLRTFPATSSKQTRLEMCVFSFFLGEDAKKSKTRREFLPWLHCNYGFYTLMLSSNR